MSNVIYVDFTHSRVLSTEERRLQLEQERQSQLEIDAAFDGLGNEGMSDPFYESPYCFNHGMTEAEIRQALMEPLEAFQKLAENAEECGVAPKNIDN